MLTFQNKKYNNWKEYIVDKFSDNSLFVVDQIDLDDENILTYRIISTDDNCRTEIVVKLFNLPNYTEIFDIYFIHPDSPRWTMDQIQNNVYGLDGQGSSFILENLIHNDEWINIPIIYGWTEKTYYFDEVEIKSTLSCPDVINGSIPIEQNYLNNYGCLTFPVVPFVIWYKEWYWKRHPERMKIIERNIPPMINKSQIIELGIENNGKI